VLLLDDDLGFGAVVRGECLGIELRLVGVDLLRARRGLRRDPSHATCATIYARAWTTKPSGPTFVTMAAIELPSAHGRATH